MKIKINLLFFLLLFSAVIYSQNNASKITGKVLDSKGVPLMGANVISSEGKTVSTNLDGLYTIAIDSNKAILTFSFTGYTTQNITVKNQREINIKLSESKNELEEIVVVGYGTQRKKDVTGAISSVNTKEMMTVPSTNVNEMLRGRVAGVSVTVDSSRPGGGSSILIRGQRSLSGSNSPLYVVDGSPVSDINDLNANDIKSIEVLKDASSQAIYGARASAGVILVTTKRGTAGKLQIDFSNTTSIQSLKKNFDLMNGQEWLQKRLAQVNEFRPVSELSSSTDPVDQATILSVIGDNSLISNYNSGRSTDWLKQLIKSAVITNTNLSLRGGNENTKISSSFNFFNQDGMILKSDFKRTTGRVNLDQKISRTVKTGINLSYTHSEANGEDGSNNSTTSNDMYQKAITLSPFSVPYDENGNLNRYVTSDLKYNPIWNSYEYSNLTKTDRFLVNLFAEIEILKGFKYRFNSKYDIRNENETSYQTRLHEFGATTNGWGQLSFRNDREWLVENIFTYDKELNKNNRFDVTFVQSANKITSETYSQSATQFLSDYFGADGISNASVFTKPKRNISPRQLMSFLGRVRYTLFDKYILSASLRKDGSSVFGEQNKWGLFPSFSLAWRINEESFLRNSKIVSDLKLRLSYGAVGNQGVGPFQSSASVNEYDMLFGNTSSYAVGLLPGNSLPNPFLKWEQTTSENVGLDFGFIKNRITGSLEWYDTRTTNLLIYKKLPANSGYSNQLTNIGEVQNTGYEAQVSALLVKNPNFSWNVNLAYSQNKNRILKIDGQTDANGKPIDQPSNGWFIGHSINAYYQYVFDGIFNSTDEIANSAQPSATVGSIRVQDLNGDKAITTDDKKIIDASPKWIGSFSSTFNYKGLELFFDLYTVQGVIKNNSFLYDYNNGGSNYGPNNGIKVDYWTPIGKGQEAPLPSGAADTYLKSLGLKDASYIRLRTVSLGYTFQKLNFLEKAGISKFNIYTSLTNFFTWSKYKAFGPETSPSSYPEPKIVNMGINVSF
jgi:TonB-linked SusC/RagA family outer membrane protein